MTIIIGIIKVALIVLIAPIIGGLINGVDRIITARMQGRVGPSVLQPFYDVLKLLQKQPTTVNDFTRYFVTMALFFNIFTVVIFFMGYDILIAIFAFTLASVFLVMAAYSSNSPYSLIGAERELLQIMSFEPMVLTCAFAYFYVTGSFRIGHVFALDQPLIISLPLIFIGVVYVLAFKLRKSPFDLSTSHHGHQELVKGITTELNGICLAMFEIMHWYETVFAIGLVLIFFVTGNPLTLLIGLVVCVLVYFFEIVCDNSFARVKWEAALKFSWIIIAVTGTVNLFGYYFLFK